MNTLELADMEHVEEYYEIIKMGREFQQEQGFTQWTEAYPDLNTIRDDIRNQKGYALKADGKIAGYMCMLTKRLRGNGGWTAPMLSSTGWLSIRGSGGWGWRILLSG